MTATLVSYEINRINGLQPTIKIPTTPGNLFDQHIIAGHKEFASGMSRASQVECISRF
jgi:hypothetical protein